jgi:NADPH:quinone reductase
MVSIIRLEQTGGPAVLKLQTVAEALLGPGEVWLEQGAIGVNYIDVTQRNGAVSIPLPSAS